MRGTSGEWWGPAPWFTKHRPHPVGQLRKLRPRAEKGWLKCHRKTFSPPRKGPLEAELGRSRWVFCPSRCRLPWWLRCSRIRLQCRRLVFDPWVGKIPWRKECNPLQFSWLEDPTDREAWQTTVHGVAKSQTGLSDYHTLTLFKMQGIPAAAGGIGDAWT